MDATAAWLLLVLPTVACYTWQDATQLPVSGRLPLHPRIIAGQEVRPGDRCHAPYNSMASIRLTPPNGLDVVVCSAVLLTKDILATAGFCMYGFINQDILSVDVVVGDRDLYLDDPFQQDMTMDSFKIHPNYNLDTRDNNIALIRLSESVTLSDCVMPAFKMQTDPRACADIDSSCIMMGWGPYTEGAQQVNSRLLREANVTVYGDFVSSILSQQRLQADQPLGSLLAEAHNPAVKACVLDWGGMVSCVRNGYPVLMGLIGEHNCNAANDPPILVTEVAYFQRWIDRCTKDWNSCPEYVPS